jgi:hypothetical protein
LPNAASFERSRVGRIERLIPMVNAGASRALPLMHPHAMRAAGAARAGIGKRLMNIGEWARNEQPRERLLARGAGALSDAGSFRCSAHRRTWAQRA